MHVNMSGFANLDSGGLSRHVQQVKDFEDTETRLKRHLGMSCRNPCVHVSPVLGALPSDEVDDEVIELQTVSPVITSSSEL